MKNNQYNKLREHKRTYDFAEFDRPGQRRFVKRRSHKRSRRQLQIDMTQEAKEME